MRILHIIHTLEYGGAERMLLSTVRAQSRTEDVYVCSMYGNDLMKDKFKLICRDVKLLNFKHKFNPLIILKIYKLIKKYDVDIVHTHLFFSSVYGQIAAKISGVPALCSEHNISNWEKNNKLVKMGLNFYSRLARRILVVSEAIKNAAIENRIPVEKIIVLHNAIDLNLDPFINTGRKKQNHIFTFGSVGRLDSRKGFDILIKACSIVRKRYDCHCVIVGDGDERVRLTSMIQELNLQSTISLVGAQSDVWSFLVLMDCFVLPSRNEGFGIAIIEAMAAGIPVIGSRVGGISEIITDTDNGLLFDSENVDDLCKKMVWIIENKNAASEMSARALHLVREKFSIEVYNLKLLGIYNNYMRY
ncbi:MAG: glycosyltransferase [Calditrichaeota bacterium]|nr:MAG: glycosyltransferase [Calditrichota bacterium]